MRHVGTYEDWNQERFDERLLGWELNTVGWLRKYRSNITFQTNIVVVMTYIVHIAVMDKQGYRRYVRSIKR